MPHETVTLETESIRLDQLLKLVGWVTTGGEAKVRIQGGEVTVDGIVETRRGRQVRPGSEVRLGDLGLRVADA